jgi:hypothetical protein
MLNVSVKQKTLESENKWCKEWLLKRNTQSHINFLIELHCSELNDWHNDLPIDSDMYLLTVSCNVTLTSQLASQKIIRTDQSVR